MSFSVRDILLTGTALAASTLLAFAQNKQPIPSDDFKTDSTYKMSYRSGAGVDPKYVHGKTLIQFEQDTGLHIKTVIVHATDGSNNEPKNDTITRREVGFIEVTDVNLNDNSTTYMYALRNKKGLIEVTRGESNDHTPAKDKPVEMVGNFSNIQEITDVFSNLDLSLQVKPK